LELSLTLAVELNFKLTPFKNVSKLCFWACSEAGSHGGMSIPELLLSQWPGSKGRERERWEGRDHDPRITPTMTYFLQLNFIFLRFQPLSKQHL
jgi:hypothetical protein